MMEFLEIADDSLESLTDLGINKTTKVDVMFLSGPNVCETYNPKNRDEFFQLYVRVEGKTRTLEVGPRYTIGDVKQFIYLSAGMLDTVTPLYPAIRASFIDLHNFHSITFYHAMPLIYI
jgi:hypothetical protein